MLKHSVEKYHWDGLEYMDYLKSLDHIQLYSIYFHKWLITHVLNKTTTGDFNNAEFKDITWESLCHHYSRFKREIKLN